MMLRQYAAEHGLTVIDDGWSGTNFDRPSFQRMIDDIEDGKINCVVTKDLSRLGRNYIQTGQYTEIYFPSKGVRYIAINDNVDIINGESELAPFLNILNEMRARQTSKKVKAAMRTRFANGAHYGACAPLGYIKDPDNKGHLLVDTENKKKVRRPKEEWYRVENTHEAIISEDVFLQVQEQIVNRCRRQKDGKTQVFSGLVKCADCGWSLAYGVNSQNKTPYAHYHCSKYGQGLHQCSMHYIRYDMLYAYVLS